jgi:predicted dehydrogenase
VSTTPVPIGILSTAHPHARAYADAVRAVDGARLVGVATDDGDPSPDAPVLPAADLLERVSGAVVCSTNATHGRWVERAASAGVDVLCEKPLATSVAEASTIVRTCDEAGVQLGVAMPLRFSEPARRARAVVDGGGIGALRLIVGTNLLGRPGADWFFDPEAAGGGAVMDHTVHVVDLVRWITGREVTEVYAETATRFHDAAVEDVDLLSMTLDDGTPFTHDGSWCQPDNWDFWGDATLRLVGSEGIVEVDCFDQTLTVTRDGGDQPGIESVYWGSDVDEGLIRDFVEAVRDDRPPAVTGTAGVREVAVVEAAYESVDEDAPVDVRYPPSRRR